MYRDELMDIYKNPVNRGTIKDPSVQVHGKNPMCGDEVTLQLDIDDAGVIKNAKFDGVACSVSVISSEILLEDIVGKRLEDVKNISKDQLLDMIGLNLSTSRVKCATLILNALEKAANEYAKSKK